MPVIVDFYADWCPPCKILGKTLETAITSSNGWNIVKLNCDDAGVGPLSAKHGVKGIPAVFFYANGKLDEKLSFTGNNPEKLGVMITSAKSLVKK